MRAVLGVLDSDLAKLETQLAEPLPTTALSETDWQAAEAARAAVERDLRSLELEAAVIAIQVSDWRSKTIFAEQRGDASLAEQARLKTAEAEQVYSSYIQEIAAVRTFLREWAARVGRRDDERHDA